MAPSLNRSPSPISSRSPSPISRTINPIARTPESGNSIRKSFGGHYIAKPSITAVPRSFNPVTPANSPADFPRSNSSSKEGIRASYEQKENERDRNSLNSVRVKSPVVSKGTKNFMSPTISAASKIAATPKKKVLTERNEPVMTSTSVTDGKSPLLSMNLAQGSEIEEIRLNSQVVSDTHKIPEILPKSRTVDFDSKDDLGTSCLPILASSESAETEKIRSKSVMGLESQVLSDTPKPPEVVSQLRSLDSEFSENLNSSLPISASPNPSLPPYDPKTNYLSPRPQFLHYKPNPRIEVYLNKEKGFDPGEGKNLEDSFTSESCSDSGTNEETQFHDTETDSTDSFSSKLKVENETGPRLLEPKSDSCNNTHKGNHIEEHKGNHIEESIVGTKEMPRKSSRSFARPKFMSILLVLAIVCLSISVTDSPIITTSSSLFKDHPPTKTYVPALPVLTDSYLRDSLAEISLFASANLEWASYNFRRLSMNSISCISRMISSPREGELGQFHFMNLTASDTDISVNKLLPDTDASVNKLLPEMSQITDIGENETKENVEESSSPELEVEGGTVQAVEEEQGDLESETVEEEQCHLESETHETMHEEVIEEPSVIDGTVQAVEEEQADLEYETVEEGQCHLESETHETIHEEVIEEPGVIDEEQQYQISHDMKTDNGIVETEEIQENYSFSSHTNIKSTNEEISTQNPESSADSATHGGLELINSPISTLADSFQMKVVLGILSILLTLAVGATSLYLKKSKASEILKQTLSPTKMTLDSVSASTESLDRSPFYRHWSAEVEMVGDESGHLEMSNSLEDTSCSRWGSERMEVQSHERQLRRNTNRESMISSSEYSEGSPSYGSFTTYEKLHSKKGSGDDVVTPVRRSSRLRKQITSP